MMHLKDLNPYLYSLLLFSVTTGCKTNSERSEHFSTKMVFSEPIECKFMGKFTINNVHNHTSIIDPPQAGEMLIPKTIEQPNKYYGYSASRSHNAILLSAYRKNNHYEISWLYTNHWRKISRIQNIPVNNQHDKDIEWLAYKKQHILLYDNIKYRKSTRKGYVLGYVTNDPVVFVPIQYSFYGTAECFVAHNNLFLFVNDYASEQMVVYCINLLDYKITKIYHELMNTPYHEGTMSIIPSPGNHYIGFDRLNPYTTDGAGVWLLDTHTMKCKQITFGNHSHYYHNLIGWKSSSQLYVYDVDTFSLYLLTLKTMPS